MRSEELNRISREGVDSAMAVHRVLGPGLLESAHKSCLAFELNKRGLVVSTEVPLPVVYEGPTLWIGYRIGFLVSDEVILEVKSVEGIAPIHRAQLLSYLRLSGRSLGIAAQLQRSVDEGRYRSYTQRPLGLQTKDRDFTAENTEITETSLPCKKLYMWYRRPLCSLW